MFLFTGRYSEAAEKYARARDNLTGMSNSEAVQLRRACVLNLSSCYLNLRKHRQCVEACQEVLSGKHDTATVEAVNLTTPGVWRHTNRND